MSLSQDDITQAQRQIREFKEKLAATLKHDEIRARRQSYKARLAPGALLLIKRSNEDPLDGLYEWWDPVLPAHVARLAGALADAMIAEDEAWEQKRKEKEKEWYQSLGSESKPAESNTHD